MTIRLCWSRCALLKRNYARTWPNLIELVQVITKEQYPPKSGGYETSARCAFQSNNLYDGAQKSKRPQDQDTHGLGEGVKFGRSPRRRRSWFKKTKSSGKKVAGSAKEVVKKLLKKLRAKRLKVLKDSRARQAIGSWKRPGRRSEGTSRIEHDQLWGRSFLDESSQEVLCLRPSRRARVLPILQKDGLEKQIHENVAGEQAQ